MRRRFFGLSSLRLTPKLTLTFVLFAALLLGVVGALSYTSGRDALEAATYSELQSTLVEKEAALQAWIGEGQTQIASIAESPFVQSQVSVLRGDADAGAQAAAHDRIVRELNAKIGTPHTFLEFLLLDPDSGKVIAATDALEEGTFKENRPYFINGRIAPYVQNVYFSLECQCAAMTASAPILSSDGDLLAVMAGQLNLDQMGTIISRSSELRASSDAYLVNSASFLVTQPRFLSDPAVLQRGLHTDAVGRCLSGGSGSLMADDYRGVRVMATYRWLADRDLCLVVKLDRSEALAPAVAFGRSMLLMILAALVIASLVAIALARTITRPILSLRDGVIRFGRGELSLRFPESSGDEIGALVREFNAMADSIAENEARLQNYANDLERRVAERTTQLVFLAEASRALSESFDYNTRLKQIAELCVPQIADWCSVDIVDENGELERLAVVHTDPQKIELAFELERRLPARPDAPGGTYRVLQTGKPEFVPEITDEMINASVTDPDIRALLHELGLKASMIVPLLAHGRALGTLTLVMAESGRLYELSDLELAEDLARRAAMMIDNARLYHQTQELNADLEQRVAERTAQLMASNQELEAFSYSVSHDLRAPLRALDGFSQALEEDYDAVLDDEGKRYLQRIRLASQRMGQLIDDLLELSRITRSEMHFEQVDLTGIAQDIIDDLRGEEPDRAVAVDVESGLTVRGDARLLRVALVNLLSNAWKYTGKQPKPEISFGMTAHDGQMVYFVRDNGAGFDMNYADKLFGVFQRLHSSSEFPGNGVGLATVQRIVHRHGGRVWAEAAVDEGATFYFSLSQSEDND